MQVENMTLQDVQDLLWALKYAQPYVDSNKRPKTADELLADPTWSDEYVRFWHITTRFGLNYTA